jgi:transposase-like protein
MAYSNNPNLPRVRGEAVALVRKGWSIRKVARHLGFTHSAVVKWVAKTKQRGYGPIPTRSPRPKKHPHALAGAVVDAIITERIGRRRCAEHVHQALKKKGWPYRSPV